MVSIEYIDRCPSLNFHGMLFAILVKEQTSPESAYTGFTRLHPHRIRPYCENSIGCLGLLVFAPRHRHIGGQGGATQGGHARAKHQRGSR